MHRWKVYTLVFLGAVGLLLNACVSKTEHDRVVSEYQQVQQEKTTLSEQLAESNQVNSDLVNRVAALEGRADTLQKENEALKAKAAALKPAGSKPAKKAPAKKKT